MHNELPVYLQRLPLNPNDSAHNYNTRSKASIHINRTNHEFAKLLLNSIPNAAKIQIETHCLKYFSNYVTA